eukprot:31228-Pelagococcus_subviridis.AAC.2
MRLAKSLRIGVHRANAVVHGAQQHQHRRSDVLHVPHRRLLAHDRELLDRGEVRKRILPERFHETPIRDVSERHHRRDVRDRVTQHRRLEHLRALPDEVRAEEPAVRPADDDDLVRVRDARVDRAARDRDAVVHVHPPRAAAHERLRAVPYERTSGTRLKKILPVPGAPAIVTVHHGVSQRRQVRHGGDVPRAARRVRASVREYDRRERARRRRLRADRDGFHARNSNSVVVDRDGVDEVFERFQRARRVARRRRRRAVCALHRTPARRRRRVGVGVAVGHPREVHARRRPRRRVRRRDDLGPADRAAGRDVADGPTPAAVLGSFHRSKRRRGGVQRRQGWSCEASRSSVETEECAERRAGRESP